MRVATYTFRHMQKPLGILGLPQRFFIVNVILTLSCFFVASLFQVSKYGLIFAIPVCALSWFVLRRASKRDPHADRMMAAWLKWKRHALFSRDKKTWSYAAGRRFQA